MAINIKPSFQSGIADDDLAEAAGQVTPTRWNVGSIMTLNSGYLVGRVSAGENEVEEIPLDTDGSLTANSDGHVPTQKAVKSYVDAVGSAAETYADGVGTAANSYADSVGSAATSAANSYADEVGSAAQSYADSVGASAANVASVIHAATSKSTPVDADEIPLIDRAASNVLKKLTWANLKATLIAAFKASASAFWAATSDALFLTPKNVKDAAAWFALTSGSTPGWNTSNGVNARILLNNNATFAAPTNLIDGWVYTLLIVQGSTGGTGAFNSIWDFGDAGAPTLSSGTGKRDLVVGVYDATTTKLVASFRKGA